MKKLLQKKFLVAKVLFVVSLVFVLSCSVALAQFVRLDGDPAGWGYGYGYGYGLGYGWDGGELAGYRISGGNLDENLYGYGYGLMSEGQTYNEEAGQYEISADDLSDLYLSGLIDLDAAGPDTINSFSFVDQTELTVAAGVTVTFAEGTTFTKTGGGTLTTEDLATMAGSIPTVTGLTGYTSEGSVAFGIPTLGLTADQAVTLTITGLSSTLNGTNLAIFHQAVGSSTWTEMGTCMVTGGTCEFTATSFSSFAAASATTTGGGSNGSGSNLVNNYCSAVSYSDWGACVGNLQYRTIATQTPAGCSVTTQQQLDRSRGCTITKEGVIVPIVGDSAGYYNSVMRAERALVQMMNPKLTNRLLGRILLQVETKGQSWYLDPLTKQRYFMGRAADAFSLMRKFGLGVSNANLAKFEKSGVPAKYAGRIFLKVEANGEAYYVNPVNMKMYYLGRPADAYRIMRELGLGITNANIYQIPVAAVK